MISKKMKSIYNSFIVLHIRTLHDLTILPTCAVLSNLSLRCMKNIKDSLVQILNRLIWSTADVSNSMP